jgi:hypothetical protein
MGNANTALKRSTSGAGAAIFVSWLLFLGPVGLLLLLGVAYAMVVQNLALGIIAGLLLATPIILTAAWIPVAFYALLWEKKAPSRAPASEVALETASRD